MPGSPELLARNTHPAATHELVGQNLVGQGSNSLGLTVGGTLCRSFVGIG